MKIITVVGARPQFVKASILSKKISTTNLFKEIIVHTGQHFDKNMSKIFFDEMNIPVPKYFLNVNNLPGPEMIDTMEMQRQFEINVKLISLSKEIDEGAAALMRLPS